MASSERVPSGARGRRPVTSATGSVATLASVRSAYASSLFSLQMGGDGEGGDDALSDQQWVLQVRCHLADSIHHDDDIVAADLYHPTHCFHRGKRLA